MVKFDQFQYRFIKVVLRLNRGFKLNSELQNQGQAFVKQQITCNFILFY